jgi:hypothetical protein
MFYFFSHFSQLYMLHLKFLLICFNKQAFGWGTDPQLPFLIGVGTDKRAYLASLTSIESSASVRCATHLDQMRPISSIGRASVEIFQRVEIACI